MKKLLFLLVMMTMPAWCESLPSTSADAIINLPLANTWKLFSTPEGLKQMGYEDVSIALQLNGSIHAERIAKQQREVLDGAISSFDPEHMLSWQWRNSTCWSVLYFNAMGNEMTQIRWLDFCANDKSTELQPLAQYHRELFDQLVRQYAPECHVCKEEREAGFR